MATPTFDVRVKSVEDAREIWLVVKTKKAVGPFQRKSSEAERLSFCARLLSEAEKGKGPISAQLPVDLGKPIPEARRVVERAYVFKRTGEYELRVILWDAIATGIARNRKWESTATWDSENEWVPPARLSSARNLEVFVNEYVVRRTMDGELPMYRVRLVPDELQRKRQIALGGMAKAVAAITKEVQGPYGIWIDDPDQDSIDELAKGCEGLRSLRLEGDTSSKATLDITALWDAARNLEHARLHGPYEGNLVHPALRTLDINCAIREYPEQVELPALEELRVYGGMHGNYSWLAHVFRAKPLRIIDVFYMSEYLMESLIAARPRLERLSVPNQVKAQLEPLRKAFGAVMVS